MRAYLEGKKKHLTFVSRTNNFWQDIKKITMIIFRWRIAKYEVFKIVLLICHWTLYLVLVLEGEVVIGKKY